MWLGLPPLSCRFFGYSSKSMKDIIKQIKERMSSLEMDQKTLSEKTKIPFTTLNRYLSHGSELRLSAFLAIAKALGVDPSTFLCEEKTPLSPFLALKEETERYSPALNPIEKAEIAGILFQNKKK